MDFAYSFRIQQRLSAESHQRLDSESAAHFTDDLGGNILVDGFAAISMLPLGTMPAPSCAGKRNKEFNSV